MKQELTEELIAGLRPGARDLLVWDTVVAGLFVKVTPAGKKSFGLYYRIGDKQSRPKLGAVGQISLDDARQLAREMLLKARREKLGLI